MRSNFYDYVDGIAWVDSIVGLVQIEKKVIDKVPSLVLLLYKRGSLGFFRKKSSMLGPILLHEQ